MESGPQKTILIIKCFGAGGPNSRIVVHVWTLLGKSLSLRMNCNYTTAKHLVVATRLPDYKYLNPQLKPRDDPAIANDVKSLWQVSPTSKPQKRGDVGIGLRIENRAKTKTQKKRP